MKPALTCTSLLSLAASTLLAVSASRAAVFTWDITQNGATIDPGNGTWNTTAGNLVWNEAGTNRAWAQTNATTALHQAVFGGTAGTYAITLATGIAVERLTFSASGYTLAASAAQNITLDPPSGNPLLQVDAGAVATIGANVNIAFNNSSNVGQATGTVAAGTLNIDGTGAILRTGSVVPNLSFNGDGFTLNVKNGTVRNFTATNSTGSIVVGAAVGSNTTMNMSGGAVTVAGSAGLVVGGVGKGTVTQTGGTITIAATHTVATNGSNTTGLTLGSNAANTSDNTFNLDGGTLNTPTIKKGSGTGTNAAVFNFNGGLLVANNTATTTTNATFMQGLSAAYIKAGGAKIQNAQNITIAQALLADSASTGGGLTKTGTGALTLAGQNTYSGATAVTTGSLLLSTDGTSASDITISSGATGGAVVAALEGQHVSTGDFNFSDGSTFYIDYGINDPNQSIAPLLVDNFTLGTGITLLMKGPIFPGVVYPLIKWTTNGPADTNAFNPVLVNGLKGTLSVDAVTKTLSVRFTEPVPVSWNTTNGVWDTVTPNWLDQALLATTFTDLEDAVIFGDAAGVSGNPVITLNSTVSPLGVKMSSSSREYTISGNGNITGAAGLTLLSDNFGTLVLTNPNNYTGNTEILAGTLRLGDGNTTGSLSPASPVSVESGAVFEVKQSDTVSQGTDFGIISGGGGFSQSGTGTTSLRSVNTFTGSTSVNNGTLQIGGTGQLAAGNYSGEIILTEVVSIFQYTSTATQRLGGTISGPGSLVKASGSGALTLGGGNSYSGSTSVSGTLNLATTNCLATTTAITMADGTSILRPTVDGVVINAPITLGGSGITARIYAPTPGAAGQVTTHSLNGAIVGTGNVRFFGASSTTNTNATILLNAQSTYSGNTELDTAGTADHFAGVNLFVKNGIENALPPTTVLTLDGDVGRGSGRTVTYDLNGFDQTLGGLTNVTTGTSLRLQRVTNTGTSATLTINNSTNYNFGSTLDAVVSTSNLPSTKIAGNVNLAKSGAGTFTLIGIHQYKGNTTVNEGTLSLQAANNFNDASTVTIASAATLNLNFTGTETVNKLFIGNVPQPDGVYGAPGSALPVIGIAQITGTGTLTVAPVPTGYAAWRGTNAGGQGPELDFDQDGTSNGVEYFINAPTGFTSKPGLDDLNAITWKNGGNIPASAYGTQFVVQTSSDLITWTDVLPGDLTANTDGPDGSLTYALTGNAPRFVRLKVTPN